MMRKVLCSVVFFLFLSTNALAQTNQVEIFDIEKGKVVQLVPTSSEIQKEASTFLQGISGVYTKVRPIPEKGYMIKVPLEPSIMVDNQWFKGLVDEVVIIFPEQEKTFLMVFDDENRLHFYHFDGNTDRFLNILHFQPQNGTGPN
ncbi:hypothetical protein LRS37_08310 [Neobacillus sedimentimangrovi]|jgi:hypothetical protein|uniref:Group-specific protein n=1 Tax=Neobacillus sedimentimangrovi TaxID=2699460 RepID=A0ABS8QJ80_9BACI|nr:hypothetical protein [Neobacillus sedimentimangrovi]MCD4838876.1 hypothetical protein [Neobacillus sedimentimangrovi]